MAYNCYSTFYIEASFAAGLVVGSLRSHLARNNAGELQIRELEDGTVEVEVSTYNPAVMSFVKDKLADFV